MPAAGDGLRLGSNIPKALIEIHGEPLFLHALRPFLQMDRCLEAVIAAPRDYLQHFRSRVPAHVRVVAGGRTRQESVGLALAAVSQACDAVLVHDAARPLVHEHLIQRVLGGLTAEFAAVVPGLPVSDTVKRVHGQTGMVAETVDREALFTVQTPQALRWGVAVEAYRRLTTEPFAGTDDVSLVEHFRLGSVRLVEGDARNIKVTTADDLRRVHGFLAQQL